MPRPLKPRTAEQALGADHVYEDVPPSVATSPTTGGASPAGNDGELGGTERCPMCGAAAHANECDRRTTPAVPAPSTDPVYELLHGVARLYKRGCRCDLCREAHRVAQAHYREVVAARRRWAYTQAAVMIERQLGTLAPWGPLRDEVASVASSLRRKGGVSP